MHVAVDLNWFLQFIVLAFAGAFGLLYLVRNTASRYFVVDSNFDSSAVDYSSLDRRKAESMTKDVGAGSDSCAVCGLITKKQCARCKMVKYCSADCQRSHWNSEHSTKCNDLQSLYEANQTKAASLRRGRKSLSPVSGSPKKHKPSNKILFPYEEFVEYFKWDTPGYPPCGLLNCGNSCFANVVLQCLSYTRPLVAYLLEKGHRGECQRDDWCFLCEFQTHVQRACRSSNPFSPMNILSRLPNIGGNLGYGKQEDAHEFMRFAIDTMQSVCLDEFGGEKVVHPSYQTTTLVQHIFGGRLQSQVVCAECNNVSNQFENMMDLTVEIHGDAVSLEECLDQFTAKESLHGDNMYKCDGCNAYVKAWKRLTIQQAPNILTIALKRFQSGRFGKLNKRVTFPETLDLNPYMSELEDENVYKLYAVIVHVDMLNASFFGHYICYVKDFRGNWYRIDDCKVVNVDLDEVLSQGAYMLLYSRVSARSSCLLSMELLKNQKHDINKTNEVDPSLKQSTGCSSDAPHAKSPAVSEQLLTTNRPGFKMNFDEELSDEREAEDAREDVKAVPSDESLPILRDGELHSSDGLPNTAKEVASHTICGIHPNSTQTSVIGNTLTELDGEDSGISVSISDGENANGCSLDVDVSLLRKLTGKSVGAENCSLKEDSIIHDVSTMDVTMTDVLDESISSNYTSKTLMTDNMEYGNGLQSHGDIQNGAKKPIFAPGFLNNRKKKGLPLSEGEASAKLNHMAQGCLLNDRRSYGNGGSPNNSDEMPSSMHDNGRTNMEP